MKQFATSFLLISLLMGGSSLWAQSRRTSEALSAIALPIQTKGWIQFRKEVQVDATSLFQAHKAAFGLGNMDQMLLKDSHTDRLGMEHFRFQLHHQSVPVEGAEYIVHARNGIAEKANGFLPMLRNLNTTPSIDSDQAFEIAKTHMNAEVLMWEIPGNESALQHARRDPSATYFPQAELLIADTDFDPTIEQYRLVWKFDIYAAHPHSKKWIYVDAENGAIVKELETLHTANSVGTAVTKYSGIRSIVTDSTGAEFRLRESKRGADGTYVGVDIETYDMNMSLDYSTAVDFVDDDNYWDNANPELDEAATDAHWGAELTHDYFWEKFARSSFDGTGSPILSYIHYDTAYFNAFWNGQWMTFGDGANAPLTSLDVVSHEFTHGVTGTSAGLIYANESGALNESFSDIFGNAVEYAADPLLFNWQIGEGFGTPFRNMADPNQFGDPDTYKGTNWYEGSGDNGGVHINSGVQNHWFYLLVQGGTGTNDFGEPYNVTAIGWEKAAAISYRNLTEYLIPISQYPDAREGALEAAADLYGPCSEEYIAVAEAWFAVGVGAKIQPDDFGIGRIEPIAACGVSDEEFISVEIEYYGCDTFPGGSLLVTYSVVDPVSLVGEQVNLPMMTRGTPFSYQFSQPLQLDQLGEYKILSRTFYPGDSYTPNDSSERINAYRKGYFTNEQIDFENFANSFSILDSLHIIANEESLAEIQGQIGKDESFGLLMEGGTINGYQVFFPPEVAPDLVNPDYTAEVCMCIDATNMDSLKFSFDLRQTFSPYVETAFSFFADSTLTRERVNVLRLMINDEEVDRYNPTSHENDPWTTHTYDLDMYLGESLNLCFLGTMNQSKEVDNFDIGDRIYLDNINFSSVSSPISSIDGLEATRVAVAFPNPASDLLNVEYDARVSQDLEVQLINALGQIVEHRSWKVAGGQNQLQLSMEGLADGIYTLKVQDEKGWLVNKIVKQGD